MFRTNSMACTGPRSLGQSSRRHCAFRRLHTCSLGLILASKPSFVNPFFQEKFTFRQFFRRFGGETTAPGEKVQNSYRFFVCFAKSTGRPIGKNSHPPFSAHSISVFSSRCRHGQACHLFRRPGQLLPRPCRVQRCLQAYRAALDPEYPVKSGSGLRAYAAAQRHPPARPAPGRRLRLRREPCPSPSAGRCALPR